jgi:hypothetical protein
VRASLSQHGFVERCATLTSRACSSRSSSHPRALAICRVDQDRYGGGRLSVQLAGNASHPGGVLTGQATDAGTPPLIVLTAALFLARERTERSSVTARLVEHLAPRHVRSPAGRSDPRSPAGRRRCIRRRCARSGRRHCVADRNQLIGWRLHLLALCEEEPTRSLISLSPQTRCATAASATPSFSFAPKRKSYSAATSAGAGRLTPRLVRIPTTGGCRPEPADSPQNASAPREARRRFDRGSATSCLCTTGSLDPRDAGRAGCCHHSTSAVDRRRSATIPFDKSNHATSTTTMIALLLPTASAALSQWRQPRRSSSRAFASSDRLFGRDAAMSYESASVGRSITRICRAAPGSVLLGR